VNVALAVLATLIAVAIVLWVAANLATAEKRLLYRPHRLYGSGDPDFRRALGILLGPPLVPGNRITTLINGDRIFPPMLAAIRAAKVSITFETFVFKDEIGCAFCKALSAAARRGVKVCILLDWLGSRSMDAQLLKATRDAGCDLQIYHPPTWFTPRPSEQPHSSQAPDR
jgi:cardiolipin synthase